MMLMVQSDKSGRAVAVEPRKDRVGRIDEYGGVIETMTTYK
jgi:hypothetical protein